MKLFSFWPALEPGRRILYFLLTALVLGAMALSLFGFFKGDQMVFPLEKQADLFPAEAHLNPSTFLLTPMRVEVNAYLVAETYTIGDMQLPLWATGVYFAGIMVAMAFFWTIASTLRRIPYYVAVALGMLWLSTLNLDLLGIFPDTSRYMLMISFGTLGVLSFLFHAFWTRVSFLARFLAFAVVLLGLNALLFHFSPLPAELTALHIVNYGTIAGFAASVLFMVLVAYENLHGLLWFNTQAQQPQRRFGLLQFVLISVLYLGNLLLLYLKQTGMLPFAFTGLDALLVFLISALVGLWGLRQRQVQYARFFSFETEAVPLYLVLALLTFLNLGYAFLLANDPLVNAYRSAIILTHLAYGVAFLLYVVINFGPLIKQKLRVYKVVYDPKMLPFFTVYLMGTVLVVVMLVRSQYALYFQHQAGYFNYLGDLYRQTEERPLLAEQFYNEGTVLSKNNLRSSFSLTDMYHQAGMRYLEMQRLREVMQQKTSPEAYLRLANLYTNSADLFDHLGVLQEAVKRYPNNAPLLNNLGLLYGTTSFADSAGFYLDAALAQSPEPEVIQANQLHFLASHGFAKQAQEFSQKYGAGTYGPLLTNRLAISAVTKAPIPANLPALPADTNLTSQSFAYAFNRYLFAGNGKDSTVFSKLDQLLRQESNQNFHGDLSLAKALLLYQKGAPAQAKNNLEALASTSGGASGYYYDILGQWMMAARLYPLAASYFQKAREAGYRDAHLHAVVAIAMAGDGAQAAQIALAPQQYPEAWQKKAATQIAIATQLSPEQATAAPDSLKVQFLQLRAASLPLAQIEAVANQITTAALAPVAAIPLVKRYLQEKNFTTAGNLLRIHFPASFPKGPLKSEANALQAELWWKNGQWQELNTQLPKLYFTPQDTGIRLYYQALLAQRNKNTKSATNLYNQLLQQAPGLEAGQLAAADFFVAQKQPMRAYELLLEAVEFNPASVTLRKAYIKTALDQGLREYALQGLEQLEPLLSAPEYLTFKSEIDAQLQATEAQQQGWQ
jgi:cellulose synthase operon protein C